jgi:hypothetical protein
MKGGSISIETLMAVIASDTSADCISFSFAKSNDSGSPYYNNGNYFLLLHADKVVSNPHEGVNGEPRIDAGSGDFYSSDMLCPVICPTY